MIMSIDLRDVERIEHERNGQACIGDNQNFTFKGNQGMVINLIGGKGVIFVPTDVIIHIDANHLRIE